MRIQTWLSRDRLAVLAALAAPLLLTVILVPFRASFPNTDAALALLLVVVAVAANGYASPVTWRRCRPRSGSTSS